MADVFGISREDIQDGSSMETIATWDSLKHMEMVAALEENLDIRFKADDIADMISFSAICSIVKNYGK